MSDRFGDGIFAGVAATAMIGVIVAIAVFTGGYNQGVDHGALQEQANWTCVKREVASGVCVEQVRKNR